MAIVSAPPERMTETAAGLLAAAAALGYPATVVATTGDTPLGLGFQVPDEVADKWHAEGVVSVSEVFDKIDDPEETKAPEAPQKRGPGRPRKPVTEGPEV